MLTFLDKILTLIKNRFRQSVPEIPAIENITKPRPVTDSFSCPYCSSQKFVRRGFRQKKRERVQLYFCLDCHKTFTPHQTKGKHYPLSIILDALSIYNLGYNLEQTCKIMEKRIRIGQLDQLEIRNSIQPSTLSNWISETIDLCRFARMREFALKKYSPKEMVIALTLVHHQLYRFRFHRAKCKLLIEEEFKHRRFFPLFEFLHDIPADCPHQYFQESQRASEAPLSFSKKQMIVRAKQNYATKTAGFVLQSVNERKDRHEALQRFMLFNDSVTVATEVPVYLTKDDLEHMQTQLGFQIYTKKIDLINLIPNSPKQIPNSNNPIGSSLGQLDQLEIRNFDLPKLITGHIDIIQIRNGQIHIMDYKPNAQKEHPIEQLTLYAMALSRLTGLRLFEFKCAWFDEKDYFEFYPLHVLYKPKKGSRRRKVNTIEGVYNINKDEKRIETIRPIRN